MAVFIIGGLAALGAIITMGVCYIDQAAELSRTKQELKRARLSIRRYQQEQAELFNYELTEIEAPDNSIKFGGF